MGRSPRGLAEPAQRTLGATEESKPSIGNEPPMDSRAHLNYGVCRHCFGTGEVLPAGASLRVTCPECEGAGATR